VLWVFFRATSFDQALSVFKGIATFQSQEGFLPSVFNTLNGTVILGKVMMLGCFIFLDPWLSAIIVESKPMRSNRKIWLFAFLVASLVLFGHWGKVDFIYFQF
jgi:hypothetical protein